MRRLGSLPIQLRITLGSLIVAAVVLTGVAGLLAFQVRAATAASEKSLAQGDLAPYLSDLVNNPHETPDKPATGVLVAIRSESVGFLVDALPRELQKNLDDRDLHDAEFLTSPATAGSSEAPTRRVTSDGVGYVVVEQHLSTSGGDFTLWAARSTASGDLTTATLDHSVVIGLIVAFLAFGASAWVLSSLSLRPVRQLARSALELSRGDTREALPVSRAGDELSTLARTLNAFIDRLRSSADRERQIVSDASHELRTPLAALTARLELAHGSFGDADALEREILAAQASVARLSDLATTLLELSRLDQLDQLDSVPAEAPRATAAELTRELLDAVDRSRVGPDSASVDVDFRVDDLDDDDTQYPINTAAFGRVGDNLLANAISFSPVGGLVRAVLEQDAVGALVLTVTDEGPGFPPDFLSLAFDRFSRADESRRRVRGGSGLGLALVRGLAEQAGGSAEVGNRAEGGAVATVRLPKM